MWRSGGEAEGGGGQARGRQRRGVEGASRTHAREKAYRAAEGRPRSCEATAVSGRAAWPCLRRFGGSASHGGAARCISQCQRPEHERDEKETSNRRGETLVDFVVVWRGEHTRARLSCTYRDGV